jgi:hypothetical protein
MLRKLHLEILKHLQVFSFLNRKKYVFWNANFLSACLCMHVQYVLSIVLEGFHSVYKYLFIIVNAM